MTDLRKLLSSIAVATVLISAGPARAQSVTPVYASTFYSDSSYATSVGRLFWDTCDAYNNPTYRLFGTYTNYRVDELVGYCIEGEPPPA